MRDRLSSLLRSLADRLGAPVPASDPGADAGKPWYEETAVPFEPDPRPTEEQGVNRYIAMRLSIGIPRDGSGPDAPAKPLEQAPGAASRAYRYPVDSGFSSVFKALNNPVDLAATLSWSALNADEGDGVVPLRDAYEQLRYEHGYHPEEISIAARPDRAAIDIVIAAPGSSPKRASRRPRA